MRSANIGSTVGMLLTVLLWPHPGSGQLPGASPAALGTANNYTALARGFASVGLNPAGLGMPGTTGITLAVLPLRVSQSLDPLTLSDLSDYEGIVVPAGVKEDWLRQITAAGGQSGSGAADVTAFSLSWNNFGLQLSTLAATQLDLNDAAAELLLFGNAGRTGEPVDLDLQGSGMSGYAVTTLGVSAAIPLAGGRNQGFSIGATLKQSWGHALAFAEDAGTMVRSDPISVDVSFPIVHPSDDGSDFSLGSGLGLDVGAAWQRGSWTASAVIQNLVNTFEWDLAELVYRPGRGLFDEFTNDSDFDERPAAEAPPALLDRVEELTFKPVIGLGGAYAAGEDLTLTAELRRRVGDGLDTGPRSHLGVGMEYRPTPAVPLRAGLAAITDGFQLGGGLGLILGPAHLGFSALYQMGDVGNGLAGAFGLSFWGG
ncbi:MAG: conjugal transfer protein TraF [Longimicrobiales bacterium]